MFTSDDEKYLIRLLSKNQVLLFLGAGFSRGVVNKNNKTFPTGWELGEKIWEFLGYDGAYDATPLPEMYQAFINAGIKKNLKIEFLEKHLLSGKIPDNYKVIAKPYWYKIYTTNIDDVLSKVYAAEGKSIKELIYPKDEFSERDQSLETTQIVYLNGKLPCEPDEIIFSTQQYAKNQLSHQPLYGQFVYDYATLPTIFIGTDLNEPLFERYIEAREGRFGFRELRPKSFLISPQLSPVKVDNLKNNYNVHYIQGTTNDFFTWLNNILIELPEKIEILRNTFPNLLYYYDYAAIANVPRSSVREFAQSFNRVPKDFKIQQERSAFLLGASPRWNDIFSELDVPRSITKYIYDISEAYLEDKGLNIKTKVINIIGSAGSGKSTILKRLGHMLSQHGRTVFHCNSETLPRTSDIINVISQINDKVVLLFDNANNVLPQIASLLKEISSSVKHPPLIVMAIRSNYSDKLDSNLNPDYANIQSIEMPDLDDNEIGHLIEKLDKHNLLGILKGKPQEQKFYEFKVRAKKQILIAMKEATNGKSFGEIISNEFESISPEEAKILCICIALNTEHSYPNSKQDIVGFSTKPHLETLSYLDTVLKGTIMYVGNKDKFMLRHKILADYIIKYCADLNMLKEAYIRVLSVLAPELRKSFNSSRHFNLYKSLINHKVLYLRFREDISQARDVYNSITTFFHDDPQFWLQYGSLELEGKGGDLTLAENYLNQAESLAKPDYRYIQNAKCNLYYKLASSCEDVNKAKVFKDKADEMAVGLLLSHGKDDAHIYHICCGGRYNYITKWVKDREQKKSELDSLKGTIKTAIGFHPRDKKLDAVLQAVQKAYILLGLTGEFEDPALPH